MKARLSLALLLTASACTCGTEVAPEPRLAPVPPSPGLRGSVVVGPPGEARPLVGIEVRVVQADAMAAHVAGKLAEARAALARISAREDRVRADARAALAENDRRSQEWKATNDADLYRRVEVLLRRPRDPGEVAGVHEDLLARKKAAYRRAVLAARRSAEREEELRALEEEAAVYGEAAFLVAGLPVGLRSVRTDASGAFALDLPPGRYAVVAVADPGSEGDASPAWILRVEVHGAGDPPLLLGDGNRHGTDCEACVVVLKELR
ncbi:MAG: hypothetical protein WB493_18060 [Anaeromyxobacteraceae bacterium]